MRLSVVIITHDEEANISRTLESVQPLVADGKGEIIVVDSGSTDRTIDIAKTSGAQVFNEPWKGYAAQKNSAIDKASGDWIFSLDADEQVEPELASAIEELVSNNVTRSPDTADGLPAGYMISRKNFFLGRWIKHGGFWPDPKLRIFRRGAARFEDRAVHEDAQLGQGSAQQLTGALLHHAYPTLSDYIDHMNRYSSLGAEMALGAEMTKGADFSVTNILLRPIATFLYNYFFRLGFLDGREGLLLHLYHSTYVSWKYAKAWESSRKE